MVQLTQSERIAIERLGSLAKVGWLSHQPVSFQAQIAQAGHWRSYNPNEPVYITGDDPDGFFGLGDGVLEVSFPLIGDEPVAIHRAEPGFWLGEAAILSGGSRHVTLTSVTKSRLFVVPASALRRLLEDNPIGWKALYQQSLNNQMATITLLAEALSLSPRARIARLLLRLADCNGEVEGSQEDIGRILGMTRSSVRRAVSSLTDRGIVASGYRKLLVLDRSALMAFQNEP